MRFWQQSQPTSNSVPLKEHFLALRAADDRRYAEVNVEREKALKIKETADLTALNLAREIQVYKDEKANELRSQIERERGTYLTTRAMFGYLFGIFGLVGSIAGLVILLAR